MVDTKQTSRKFEVKCCRCGQYISKKDVFSGDLEREDVGGDDTIIYDYVCRTCSENEWSSQEVELAVQ